MDLYKIIRELVQERDRLEKLIHSLEEISTTSRIVPRPPGKRRGRKSMDAGARAEVSQRMKKYWAERRSEGSRAPSPKPDGNAVGVS